MSFFQRLVSYVINDVAVKALSNSRAFQRFALKTHYHVEDAKTMASTGTNALKNSFENYAPKVKEFGEAFREECATMLRELSRLVLKTPKKVIHLSYWVFAVWWVVILSVHVITCVFNALYAYSYWKLKGSYLNLCLAFYQIGLPEKDHGVIIIVHAIVSTIHGICILLMLGGSLRQNSLAFTPWSSSTAGSANRRRSSALLQSFIRLYSKVMYPFSLCGVNGKYFHFALNCRELVETTLQTVQAYRMSTLLPRTLLNRFYVVLLVANCWSSHIADSVFFGRDEARRRFACIVMDCILDLMACTGVVVLVLLDYVGDYDPTILSFNEVVWYDDEWVARALNELRMVVIVSWSDLMSRTMFSLGLVITTTSMKRLLWQLPRNGNRKIPQV
uniref:Uncharacterized protein n=1 Tax=Phytophthora ramorum TaxID=164328 RepID=H3GII0_PHYRM